MGAHLLLLLTAATLIATSCDRIKIEVRLGTLGKVVDVLKAVLGPGTELPGDSIRFGPDVSLYPAPAQPLDGQNQLINIRVPLPFQRPLFGDAVLDI